MGKIVHEPALLMLRSILLVIDLADFITAQCLTGLIRDSPSTVAYPRLPDRSPVDHPVKVPREPGIVHTKSSYSGSG